MSGCMIIPQRLKSTYFENFSSLSQAGSFKAAIRKNFKKQLNLAFEVFISASLNCTFSDFSSLRGVRYTNLMRNISFLGAVLKNVSVSHQFS